MSAPWLSGLMTCPSYSHQCFASFAHVRMTGNKPLADRKELT